MTDDPIVVTIENGIAHLELARPQKANAMDHAFWSGFPQAIDSLDADTQVRVIVISGRGRHFSAGIDLGMMQSMMPDPKLDPGRVREKLRRTILRMQDSFTSLDRCRKPVIAAIHGGCLGAGVDLVTACDMRVAAENVRFAIQEINIGMVADVGTFQRAGHLLPHGILRELAYTGRDMGATEASRYGFVNAVEPDRESAIKTAMDMAVSIATKSPLAIAGVKDVLNHARDHSIHDGLNYVAAINSGILVTEDVAKGATAALAGKDVKFSDLLS